MRALEHLVSGLFVIGQRVPLRERHGGKRAAAEQRLQERLAAWPIASALERNACGADEIRVAFRARSLVDLNRLLVLSLQQERPRQNGMREGQLRRELDRAAHGSNRLIVAARVVVHDADCLMHGSRERIERDRLLRVAPGLFQTPLFGEEERVPLVRGGIARIQLQCAFELTLGGLNIGLLPVMDRGKGRVCLAKVLIELQRPLRRALRLDRPRSRAAA